MSYTIVPQHQRLVVYARENGKDNPIAAVRTIGAACAAVLDHRDTYHPDEPLVVTSPSGDGLNIPLPD